MSNAVNCNLFKGFEVKSGGMVILHLRYADDTLCIGEPTVDNLWMLKAILRGFKMASGLKVNFHKRLLIGVNVSMEFIEVAFVDKVPFLSSIWGYPWELIQRRLQRGSLC